MSTQFTTPVVTEMQVIPVAGHDSMLMNLSGAHAPFFTRNIVIIKDNSGHTGVGEIPGGEKIRKTLEDAIPLVVGKTLGEYKKAACWRAKKRPSQSWRWRNVSHKRASRSIQTVPGR